jgi:hypothetical protein
MNVNLAKFDLYEDQIIEAVRLHGRKLDMSSKKEFDRAATFFVQYGRSLSPKIDKALDQGKDLMFVAGGENANRVVVCMRADLFPNLAKRDKMILDRVKELAKSFDDRVNFNVLSATANVVLVNKANDNKMVACLEFRSSYPVRNFCVIA